MCEYMCECARAHMCACDCHQNKSVLIKLQEPALKVAW